MSDFISEDDLLTFEGWLRYQAPCSAPVTPQEVAAWRHQFDAVRRREEGSPKVGLMKLRPVPGEQRYAVALRHLSELWITLWVRCSSKGEIFIFRPHAEPDWTPHVSYHLDGRLHHKTHNAASKFDLRRRQPLTACFRGIEYLGTFGGHGRSAGAVCAPEAFDGVVAVEPGILGPAHGAVTVDLVEPGFELWATCAAPQRRLFTRGDRPSILITIWPGNQGGYTEWPNDFARIG